MKQAIRAITNTVYKYLAKPMLFRRTPDHVHSGLLSLGSIVQRIPIVSLLPGLWSHRQPDMLAQQIHGISYQNPIGLSAGFDKNIELVPLMRRVGFGFMTGGSVTFHECAGNTRPWFYRLAHSQSIVVRAGLPNHGVRRIYARLEQYPAVLFVDFPLVLSVAKTNSRETISDQEAIDDYVGSLVELEGSSRVSQYEINISCPNAFGGEPFTTPAKLNALLAAIDELRLARPVYIKMPIDLTWGQFRKLLEVICAHNVQGVTIGNLRKNRENLNLEDTLTDDMRGGLSGAPTRELSTELIRRTYAAYGDQLTIIGVGGIFAADDAYQKIRAGASLVELITGVIFGGPQIVGQINHDLARLLARDGYHHISEAIGADHRSSV